MGNAGFEIREMKVRDLPWVAPLLGELGYPVGISELQERFCRLDATGAVSFVAEKDGTIVGWIHLIRRDTLLGPARTDIIGLVVKADVRGLGVGKALVAAGLKWSRDKGVARVRVMSDLKRTESHPFYKNLGFTLTKQSAVYDLPV